MAPPPKNDKPRGSKSRRTEKFSDSPKTDRSEKPGRSEKSGRSQKPRRNPVPLYGVPGKQLPEVGQMYTGVFQGRTRGGGFVILETPNLLDVFVPEELAANALHGDQVLVRIERHAPRGPLGEVQKVLRHHNKQIVGQLFRSRRISVVTPKNPRIARTVEIPRIFKEEEVPDGAWVVAEVTRWSHAPDQPLQGKLVEVLGAEGERRLPILLLIRGAGVVPEFPEEVASEAERLAAEGVTEKELARRRDFRGERVCTIDPATAKDFDDAVHLVGRVRDGWRIGVHIADVAHYVTAGSPIDAEAYDRATSIYPVDRVIPMLPEALSNQACSLRPDEESLTLSALFTVTQNGGIKDVELFNGVIRSVRRFAYEDVQALYDEVDGVDRSGPESGDGRDTGEGASGAKDDEDIGEGGDGSSGGRKKTPHPVPEIDPALREDLMTLREAARALRAERDRRGALDLDLAEPEVIFNPEGIVENIRRKERMEAHRFIEDLMVAANEAVANEMKRRDIPVLYRVHDEPNEEKLESLLPAFARFGIHLPGKGVKNPMVLHSALEQAARHPAGEVVVRWVLRALPRAVYQPRNIGHYGLGSDCYLHFTSPIRRYPDLVVHRAVKAMLKSAAAVADYKRHAEENLDQWGRHCSEREQRAQRIEWDAQKILSYEFMKRHIGGVFDGFIAGAMAKGFFVELVDYPVEGFVPVRYLADDFYVLDEEGLSFVGQRTGRAFSVGSPVKVQIERVDPLAGEMDLNVVRREGRGSGDSAGESAGEGGPRRSRRKADPHAGKHRPYNWQKHVKRSKARKGRK